MNLWKCFNTKHTASLIYFMQSSRFRVEWLSHKSSRKKDVLFYIRISLPQIYSASWTWEVFFFFFNSCIKAENIKADVWCSILAALRGHFSLRTWQMTKACPSSRCLPVTWRATVVSDVPLIRRAEGPRGMCSICERFITIRGYYTSYHVTCPTLVPRLRDLRQICRISCRHNIHNHLLTWCQTNEIMTKIEYCPLFLSITSFYGFTDMKNQTKNDIMYMEWIQ